MSARAGSSGAERGTELAVSRFLTQFPGADRAQAVHVALKALRDRVEPDRVLMCELAWEVHTRGYWSQVRRDDGSAYESEETYLRDVLGLASWRTAYKRLAIGRMLVAFPEPERSVLRAAIAAVGVAKAAVIAPAIERTREWQAWTELAQKIATPLLQARVSAALEAVPRGREPSPPGERFRRAVLSAMPDIEAMEVVERFFEVGAKVVGTLHPVGIFLTGCRECLAEWEVQAARRGTVCPPFVSMNDTPMSEWSASPSPPGTNDQPLCPPEDCPRGQTCCPHGQNVRALSCGEEA